MYGQTATEGTRRVRERFAVGLVSWLCVGVLGSQAPSALADAGSTWEWGPSVSIECDAQSDPARKWPASGYHAMVAAAHPAAARAGCEVLSRGGSAADAAVAVQMVLAVVEPQSSGLAGGTVIMHHDSAEGAPRFFDGLSRAPAAVTADLREPTLEERTLYGVDRFTTEVGSTGRAVGVPGTVRVLSMLHQQYGRLPWGELFEVSIKLAESGFPMPAYLHTVLQESTRGRVRCDYPDLSLRYCVGQEPKPLGSTITQPELAMVLRMLRDGGADWFYDPAGPIALSIVERAARGPFKAAGDDSGPAVVPSLMTALDMGAYRAMERSPLCQQVLGHRVCTAPPPSFGGIAVVMQLGLLQRGEVQGQASRSIERVHLLLESSRMSQLDRSQYIGDPDFGPMPTTELLAPSYLDARFSLFSPSTALHPVPVGQLGPLAAAPPSAPRAVVDHAGDMTSHVSIVDADGHALSMTTTINSTFGAQMVALGMPLNNVQENFTRLDSAANGQDVNGMAPNKRPRTSMAPTLVFGDGRAPLELVVGGAGGSGIPDYVVQVLVGILVDGLSPQQAINLGHYSGQRLADDCGGIVDARSEVEAGSELEPLLQGLQALGHPCAAATDLNSGLSAIQLTEDGTVLGAADPRRDGVAIGF